MPETTPEDFATARRAVVIAPAGCGKTELIVRSVASVDNQRDLILTHTHAGLRVVKERLHRFRIGRKRAVVETIAGWCLRLAASYPKLSSIPTVAPSSDEWGGVYQAAVDALGVTAIRAMIANSYSGLYVDEYQDCTKGQHAVIRALAELLPCRVVGDPLQSIFNFGDDIIDWSTDVETFYDALPRLETPHRWAASNPELGHWLLSVREDLLRGGTVNLADMPVTRIAAASPAAIVACKRLMGAAGAEGTVVAIGRFAPPCHDFAKNTHGFVGLEPVECPDLLEWASKMDDASPSVQASIVTLLITRCFSGLSQLKTDADKYQHGGSPTVKSGKFAPLRTTIKRLAQTGNATDLVSIFETVNGTKHLHEGRIFRPELWNDAMRASRGVADAKAATLHDAAWARRDYLRNTGGKMPRFAVGRPLLIKGLEFDHALVLAAGAVEFNREELYVALTRGSATLTVASDSALLAVRVPITRGTARVPARKDRTTTVVPLTP